MSHFPRLLRILNTVAKYRLDEYLRGQPGYFSLQCTLLPFKLANIGSGIKGSKHQRLRQAMEELGPIYIKFGQLLSTRRDFLDVELADELQALQDKVPPFKHPDIRTLVAEALGQPASEIFNSLNETPLASASVAQVHEAILLNGDRVVVKVLRPGIEKIVRADIKLLKWAAELVESASSLGKRLRPIEVVRDYETVILEELNLQSEAANTSQLRRNFEDSPNLYVPKVYWDYTRRNMLVMERIDGIPVTDLATLAQYNVNLKALAETGVNIFFNQVFEHNFFHADMHPGNIFVSKANGDRPQYIAIDCAIIGSLSSADQDYLAKNLLAIFKRDYRRVAELHVECGWVPPHTRVNEFESAIRSVCEPIFEKPLKEISFGQILVQLFRTAGRFDMEVQPSLVLLQKTLLNIEGLGRQLYPELDLWQTALPYLESWNAKRLNPFTLIRKFQENLPDWVDQLPVLPIMLLNAVGQAEELSKLNKNLQAAEMRRKQLRRKRVKRARTLGVVLLLLAGSTLLPPVAMALAAVPVITLGLAGLGAYLLSFRN